MPVRPQDARSYSALIGDEKHPLAIPPVHVWKPSRRPGARGKMGHILLCYGDLELWLCVG